MPRSVAARERRRDLRVALVGSATELFAVRGVDGTSLDAVARAAGVTKGAIYSNFTGKQALATSCLGNHLQRRGLRVSQSMARAPRDSQLCAEIAADFVQALYGDGPLSSQLFREFAVYALADDDFAARYVAGVHELCDVAAERFKYPSANWGPPAELLRRLYWIAGACMQGSRPPSSTSLAIGTASLLLEGHRSARRDPFADAGARVAPYRSVHNPRASACPRA